MFARVELRVADLAASRRFYETVLGALPAGMARREDGDGTIAWGDFAIAPAHDGETPTRAAADPLLAGVHRDPDGNCVELLAPGGL